MKKNDIALLVLVVSISLVASYFILNKLLGNPSEDTKAVEQVPKISAKVPEAPDTIFNKNAINPTVQIKIGNPSQQQPF